MAEPIIKYKVYGFNQMFHGVERLTHPPDFHAIGKLEAVLAEQFATSQAEVHEITGSLRLSGKTSTDYDGFRWIGEISYGGASGGVNDPVTYAQAEVARRGTHAAFLRNLYGRTYIEEYEDAIKEIFRGSSGDT